MKAERLQRIEELFHAALERDEARPRFLEEGCADDGELRAEVEALLQANAQAPEFIVASTPLLAPDPIAQSWRATQRGAPQLGDRLGPYRLLREIGRGGMGEVYLAARDDDEYRKQVAIKLVRRGMDIDSIIRTSLACSTVARPKTVCRGWRWNISRASRLTRTAIAIVFRSLNV